jgi:hypothetical protein
MVLPSTSRLARIGLASAKLMNKDSNIDLEPLYVCVSGNILPWYEGLIRWHLSQILLNIDDHHISEAQHWIEEATEADERHGMRFHLGRDYALYADLFKRKGDRFRAKEQLGRAIDLYKECGADGWVTKAEDELGRLS